MDSNRATLPNLPDYDLELRLFDLGEHIVWPPAPDLAPYAVINRPSTRPRVERRHLWLAAALLLASLGAGLVLSQGFRDTVAGVFGVRGVDIEILREDLPAASPGDNQPIANLTIGQSVSRDEAIGTLPFQPWLPAIPGEPDGLYIRVLPGSNLMLSAAYAPQPGLPEAAETGVGLLLMQFTSEVTTPMLIKQIGDEASVLVQVDIGGASGYWIEGASQLTILAGPSTGWDDPATRPSANVLLWQADGVTYRMESALSRFDAVEVAESMQPLD